MKHDTASLHIVVVEDNDGLRDATVDFLTANGHSVSGMVCAEDVDDTPTRDLPDLYLIDVNLPGENGFALAARIRRSQPRAGIVIMTARGQLNDRLEGYGCGADNYLVKPVEQAELLACIGSLAHRLRPPARQPELQIALDSRTLQLRGPAGTTGLSHPEAVMLTAFARAAGRKLERWQAMQLVDTQDKGLLPASMEMRISALRKKLRACGASDDAIRTIRGFGYALTCAVEVV